MTPSELAENAIAELELMGVNFGAQRGYALSVITSAIIQGAINELSRPAQIKTDDAPANALCNFWHNFHNQKALSKAKGGEG